MTMFVQEDGFEFRAVEGDEGLLTQLQRACEQHILDGAVPVRFVVTQSTSSSYHSLECGGEVIASAALGFGTMG